MEIAAGSVSPWRPSATKNEDRSFFIRSIGVAENGSASSSVYILRAQHSKPVSYLRRIHHALVARFTAYRYAAEIYRRFRRHIGGNALFVKIAANVGEARANN